MKKFALLLSLAFVGSMNLMAQEPATTTAPPVDVVAPPAPPALPVTTISWKETVYDFGTIEQGTPVTHKFTFTNTGKEDLVITEVKRTCGCTGLEWVKEAVKPGQDGWVDATFNAAMPGHFSKTIFFNANIEPNPVGLTFQGEVQKKEEMNLNNNTLLSTPTGGTTTPAGDGHNHPH